MEKNEITPLLLGLDLGAYSMAVAFHEACGVVSHAIGREKTGATMLSKIVKAHIVPNILDDECAVSVISEFSRGRENVLLVPCEDWYVMLAARIRNRLPKNVKVHLPDYEILKIVSDKSKFYDLLDGFGIDYPKTAVFYSPEDVSYSVLEGFDYPIVVKPSDSTEYWRHPFDGMKKVYFPNTKLEALDIINRIFKSGYSGDVIAQKKIGNGEEYIGVYTVVTDKDARVRAGVFGEVMLGEPTPTGRGNHVAILTGKKPDVCKKIDSFLQRIGYSGIANFDLIFDGFRWYVLELNPRQGRSSDYMRAAGVNLAELLISVVYGGQLPEISASEIFWRSVPRRTLYHFCPHVHMIAKAQLLSTLGCESYLYAYGADVRNNLMRRAYSIYHATRHNRRFHRYGGGR